MGIACNSFFAITIAGVPAENRLAIKLPVTVFYCISSAVQGAVFLQTSANAPKLGFEASANTIARTFATKMIHVFRRLRRCFWKIYNICVSKISKLFVLLIFLQYVLEYISC